LNIIRKDIIILYSLTAGSLDQNNVTKP